MRYGEIIVEQSHDTSIYADVVAQLKLKPPIIIKPNWGMINNYTEAEVIDGLLSAIKGEAVVTESYGWARTEDALLGKGIGSLKKDDLRRSDKWFLKTSGMDRVLERHDVKYVNVTEEVWAKRTVDPATIRDIAGRCGPLRFEEFYGQVPKCLFDLRGGTFLSLAKYRLNHDPIVVSLTLKNLFGMIPGPRRGKYHGKEDALIAQGIVDINKVYHSVFDTVGMVDAIHTASIGRRAEDAIRPEIARGKGLLLGCRDRVRLDAFVAALEGRNPSGIGYLKLAAETFGGWEAADIEAAGRSGLRIFR